MSTSSLWAVFPFVVDSDLTGSWSGDGTPNTNISPGIFSSSPIVETAVADFTSGTFSITDFGSGVSDRVSSDLGLDFSVSLTGSSGHLGFANSGSFDDGGSLFNSIGLQSLGGVTSISVTLDYSQFIAGRNNANGNIQSRAMLAALGLVSSGSGLSIDNFDVSMSFGGAFSAASSSDPFVSGFGTGQAFQASGWDPTAPGATTFNASGFDGLVNLGDSSTDFLFIRGYDDDGDGYDGGDSQLYYASSQTWTITPADGATSFDDGTQFVFSLDGQQHSNLSAVPEPAAAIFCSLSILTLLRRRRS